MSTLILPKPSTEPGLYYGKYVAGLFANNEQGVWYDPSNLSTLYQDYQGRTPVTAVGQPVGLIMDARRAEIFKITKADLLDTTKWVGIQGPTASQNPDGSIRITRNTTWQYCAFVPRTQSYVLPPGCAVRVKVSFTASTTGFQFNGEPYFNWRDVNPGFLAWFIPAGSVRNENIVGVNLTGGSISSNMTVAPTLFGFYMSFAAGDPKASSDYIDVLDFEITAYYPPARQTSTTSRPVLQQDSAGKYYLQFDGVDDWLQTGSINFTSTDKMTVWAGVRKLSDAASGAFIELSSDAALNRAFGIFAPSTFGGMFSYRARSTGSLPADLTISGYPAPISNVVALQSNIATDLLSFRVNGTQAASTSTDQGTGNYGNYPLYIGRRNGVSNPFNGRLYGLIVRGAQTDDLHLTNVERYLANKSGIVL